MIAALEIRGCAPRDVDLDRKMAFLGSTMTYAECARVKRIETHFSCVFLTDKQVYKLKKPMSDGGIGFSTIEARRRNAEQELILNRRLLAMFGLIRDA